MFSKHTFRVVALLAGVAAFSPLTWAAGAEISASGGGVSVGSGGGTHGEYGVEAGVGIGDRAHIFGEFGFSQIASQAFQTSSNGVNVSGNVSVNLANYGAGFDYGFGSSKKVIPYVVAAGGVGHFFASGAGTGSNGVSASVSIPVANDGYLGVGGGLRLFIGSNWGVKPEFRFQRYFDSGGSLNTYVYSAGIFWEFGK